MCGIFYTNFLPNDKVVNKMFKTLEARGPDAQGLYKKDFLIGHTRLSIIDLDKRSNQPMSIKGYTVAFNGEIYNYKQLKEELKNDWKFITNSDTEVIIALYHKYGVEGWKFLNGMFSFIFYHESRDKIFFLRDPVGIKPLYFHIDSGKIIVASKQSTILECIKTTSLNYRAVNDILAFGYPKLPIYQNIYEFNPGYVYDRKLNKKKINFIIDKNKTFKKAIIERFVNSDRPVGITLSGGIDSGYIAYVCSKISKTKIHTFTIGFSKNDDDVIAARKVAKLIDSDHHEIIVPKSVYDECLKEGIDKLESPFDLGSVAMTNLLGKEIAKTNIKVILIGEGADEIQGGYKRYSEKSGIRTKELWDWYQKRVTKNNIDDRKKVLGDNTFVTVLKDECQEDNANKILYCDFVNELRCYHLKRIDHIISEFGIEARVPYLDYSIVCNSFKTNFSKKINQRGNKLLLRDFAVKDGYPEELAFRPKLAFKRKDFNAKEHLVKLWQKWLKEYNLKI